MTTEEEYGDERLFNLIEKHHDLTSEKLTHEIMTDVRKFTKEAPQMDDITLMIMKRSNKISV